MHTPIHRLLCPRDAVCFDWIGTHNVDALPPSEHEQRSKNRGVISNPSPRRRRSKRRPGKPNTTYDTGILGMRPCPMPRLRVVIGNGSIGIRKFPRGLP